MKEKKNDYPNPDFTSIEEEDAYWQNHSPLTEGYEGTVQGKSQRRSSYLALLLSGEELRLLRDTAKREGVGFTTLARNLILQGLDKKTDLMARIEALEQKWMTLAGK